RVALDEVVAARDHGMRRMGKPRDRQQDREDALPGHADEVRREAAGETISGRDWKRPRLPDRAVLDGVYRREGEGRLRFVPVPAPTSAELNRLVQRVAERIGRSLERSGLITRDIENAYLAFD